MNYKEYVNKNKEIQNNLLLFLDKEDNIEENYTNLLELIRNYKIIDNPHELKMFLYLISNICNNHYQTPKFNYKIEQLFKYLKESIKNNFSNQKIFDIFQNSKMILLILIEQEIITFDESILIEISSRKYFRRSYHQFFFPEIRPLIEKMKINKQNKETNSNEEDEDEDENESDSSENDSEENDDDNENDSEEYDDDSEEYDYDDNSEDEDYDTKIDFDFYQSRKFKKIYKKFSEKMPDNFLNKRKIGQNETHICKLIREDLIDEFITYVNKNMYSLKSYIEKSIFETNDFLIEQNKTRLIEYAAFFGSTQIFKYLYKNGVELKSQLWIYGIHSDNAEIIQLLEDNKIEPPNKSYKKCIKESIKCHHNDITNYILSNLINEDIENINNINFKKKYDENIYLYSFHYYNFSYFPKEIEHQILFCYACEYDYIDLVDYMLKTKKIDIKSKIIFN